MLTIRNLDDFFTYFFHLFSNNATSCKKRTQMEGYIAALNSLTRVHAILNADVLLEKGDDDSRCFRCPSDIVYEIAGIVCRFPAIIMTAKKVPLFSLDDYVVRFFCAHISPDTPSLLYPSMLPSIEILNTGVQCPFQPAAATYVFMAPLLYWKCDLEWVRKLLHTNAFGFMSTRVYTPLNITFYKQQIKKLRFGAYHVWVFLWMKRNPDHPFNGIQGILQTICSFL